MASVEFSGMIREEPSAGPSPFREVWNMTKPKKRAAAGWWQGCRPCSKRLAGFAQFRE
jgi:predicted lipid-binding transport protein (Tim44 family)